MARLKYQKLNSIDTDEEAAFEYQTASALRKQIRNGIIQYTYLQCRQN
ncbi:hypothetical protein MIR68_005747 [Amoeboaphelidium protococcarum]|nr:hypothetical protein MIR68_005747 [Amoeboaphelidium protococcarum]